MNRYLVFWQTKPSPGFSFYKGDERVWADNEEDAQYIALREVNRRLFPEYKSISHLKTTIILKLED